MIFSETCILIYPGQIEGYNDYREPIYSEPRRETVYGWVETAGTNEDTYFANQREWSHDFYFAEDTDPNFEQIEWGGDVFDVVGKPLRQPGGLIVDGWLRAGAKVVEG